MKVLFWNLKKNPNENWIADVLKEKDIDIAIFAEYSGTNFPKVEELTEGKYKQHDGYNGCEKITLISKITNNVIVRREQNRYTIYSCFVDGENFIMVGVHLPPKPIATASDRKDVIRELISDICEQEKNMQNRRTVVIGDFNCNPFDEELIEKSSMNAVLFKELIDSQEIVVHQDRKYRRFYNPTIHYLSESNHMYGSIYSAQGNAQIYWNSFDQVMVRKELCNDIRNVTYITSIGGKSLIKKIKPNDKISDHLPLFVTIEKGI